MIDSLGSFLLLVAVLVPIAGSVLLIASKGRIPLSPQAIALGCALLSLTAAVILCFLFDEVRGAEVQMNSLSNWDWLGGSFPGGSGTDIRFHLGVDGISLWLIALSALLSVTSVLVSWESIKENPHAFFSLLLLLSGGMIGVFAAQDIILFYIFFEFTLIPLFFLIGIWGSPEHRQRAARKFFIFTLAGSVLTFLGLIYIVAAHYRQTDVLTFSIPTIINATVGSAAEPAALRFTQTEQHWLFLALLAGFAIKIPLFPVHTWLPLAHTEAPTAGSVLLAGVLLKIGTYGVIRFMLPLLPLASVEFLGPVGWLAVAGIIYGALTALAQDDVKRLVAYSSVSHMGFCVLGLFAFNSVGISGGVLQTINHGLSTGALFAMVGMLYDRYHTRKIDSFGGMARRLPILTFFFVVITLSSIGLPGLNGFIGEFMILAGIFKTEPVFAVLAATGIILGAFYMLWLVQRVFFGPLKEPTNSGGIQDLSRREILTLAPITALCVVIGLFPNLFLSRIEPAVKPIVARYADLVTVGSVAGGEADSTAASGGLETLTGQKSSEMDGDAGD